MRRMKGMGRILLSLILTAAMIFPAYGTKSDIEDAKNKASSLEKEKARMEETLKELENLKHDTEAYVKQLDRDLNQLNQELADLQGQIAVKEEDIRVTQEELDQARKTEEKQYASMKLRIQYMYENGDASYLDLLFQAKDISQLMNRAEYITKISEYDRKMLNIYIDTKNQIAQKEQQLKFDHDKLVALEEATKEKQNSVELLMEQKKLELKNYENRIAQTSGQIDAYQKDINAQEQRVKQIEAEIKRKEEEARKAAQAAGKKYNTANIGNIKFIWPCPSSSRITSTFGGRESPMEGASSYHQGVDIGSATGNDILAAADGDVVISTYSYSAGNYIMVNHGGGVSTVYMHCSQLLVSEGDHVTQGQVIAKVGSTGYSTGPHLHFGVRVDGTYVNPLKYVSP